MRRVHFVLLFLVLVIGAQPLVAVTYYVTHQPTLLCTNNKTGYSIFLTIQDAVTRCPQVPLLTSAPEPTPNRSSFPSHLPPWINPSGDCLLGLVGPTLEK